MLMQPSLLVIESNGVLEHWLFENLDKTLQKKPKKKQPYKGFKNLRGPGCAVKTPVSWLILLPGVTTITTVVATVRCETQVYQSSSCRGWHSGQRRDFDAPKKLGFVRARIGSLELINTWICRAEGIQKCIVGKFFTWLSHCGPLKHLFVSQISCLCRMIRIEIYGPLLLMARYYCKRDSSVCSPFQY